MTGRALAGFPEPSLCAATCCLNPVRSQCCVPQRLPHRLLVCQACGVAEELRPTVPPGSAESAAAGGHEQPAPAALQALRRLYARQCSSDEHMGALEAGLAASLGEAAAGSSPLSLDDLARVLSAFEYAGWQPSAMCLQRAAQWLTARAAAGTWRASEIGSPACSARIARAWASFAVWRACESDRGADSVACCTLPGVAGALQGYLAACGDAQGHRPALEDIQRGIATALKNLDSVKAVARAKCGTGGVWDWVCTIAALQSFYGDTCAAIRACASEGCVSEAACLLCTWSCLLHVCNCAEQEL